VPHADLEQARARFVELAPAGYEEVEAGELVELAAYGEDAERVLAAFPDAVAREVEAGWEERWRAFHRPVEIGPLWVGPPWEAPPADALAVVVDPGRAFGTGAHATTRLCLELLLEQPAGSVLDVGCGSGVLAIAAARLGHAPVTAVDVDEAAVAATLGNAAANGVVLDVARRDATIERLPAADLALANIAAAAVVGIAAELDAARLVTSGYLAADEPVVEGFRRLERRLRDGWAADLFERR
jgi:ribosomal protein L11 methyltransferase